MNTQTHNRNGVGQNGAIRNGHASTSNGQAEAESRLPPIGVARSIGSMVGDVVSLAELQLQLFKRDTSEAAQRTYMAAGVLLIGSLILLSCLPVGMMALAHLLHQTTEISLAASYVIVLALGMLTGGITAYLGFMKLRNVGNVYRRSQEELALNVRWLKSSLKR